MAKNRQKIPHQTPLLRGAFAALVVDRVVVVFCFNHVSWLFFVSNLPGDARETTRRRPVVSRSCPGRLPVVSRSSPGRLPVVSRETTGRLPVVSWSCPGRTTTEMLTWGCGRGYEA